MVVHAVGAKALAAAVAPANCVNGMDEESPLDPAQGRVLGPESIAGKIYNERTLLEEVSKGPCSFTMFCAALIVRSSFNLSIGSILCVVLFSLLSV